MLFGRCVDLVSIFLKFFALLVELDLAGATTQTRRFLSTVSVPFGSGQCGPRVELLRTMKTNSALGEKVEEDGFDAKDNVNSLCDARVFL